jgi:hypothetical protein
MRYLIMFVTSNIRRLSDVSADMGDRGSVLFCRAIGLPGPLRIFAGLLVSLLSAPQIVSAQIPAVLFTVLMIAQPQRAECGEPSDFRAKLMARVNRPTTAIEAWRNLKFALDNDLFLRDDFYSDENLKKFFATAQISWRENLPTRTTGTLFSPYFEIFLIRGTIDEKGNADVNARRRGGGTIGTDATADLVIAVFGKPMKVTNPYAAESPEHPTALTRKTHEFGNLSIEYSFDHARTTASLRCLFNGNGTVKACGFGNVEK